MKYSAGSTNSTNDSQISKRSIKAIIEKLKAKSHRSSTYKTYLSVWRKFNGFLIKLDIRPKSWEQCTYLFIADLIDQGAQSSTVKSYISAIKCMVVKDNYKWDDNAVAFNSLMKACRLVNDRVKTRLPIYCGFLELILFEVQRHFRDIGQKYLEILYKALFALGYYGLMRVGELTFSDHVLKAKNTHIASNKEKILVVLYSSKTHHPGNIPQEIKITGKSSSKTVKHRHFCPF